MGQSTIMPVLLLVVSVGVAHALPAIATSGLLHQGFHWAATGLQQGCYWGGLIERYFL